VPPREQHRLRVAALLVVVSLVGCGAPESESASGVPSGKGLNVLLISIDTLRADHLGCYGYQRPTSPNIDAFAKESVRFDQAISQAPWTTPSHMTLMTSLYPSSHKLNRSWSDYRLAALGNGRGRFPVLARENVTLAEVLRGAGYETLALTGGATVSGALGFDHGFDEFVEAKVGSNFWGQFDFVWDQLRGWLDRPRTKSFFLFWHTFQVHAPYQHPELASDLMTETQRAAMETVLSKAGSSDTIAAQEKFLAAQGLLNVEVTRALYDGGIHYVDAFIGRLFDDLKRRGLYDRTLIVIVSDHGETFGEHGGRNFFNAHGWAQYEELIHVPLVVRFPPLVGRPRAASRPVGLIDVAPTILELLGVDIPGEMQGRSRSRLLVEDSEDLPWTVSEASASEPAIKAWREDRYKYIATFGVGKDGDPSFIPGPLQAEELYDLIADPGERRNLASAERELLELKRALLRRHFELLAKRPRAGNRAWMTPDSKLQEDLKALGYL
jgi:arylsulfatase A-like enzyme